MMIGPHGSPAKIISNANGFPYAISPNIIAVVSHAIHAAWDLILADSSHLAPATPGNPEEDRYTEAICNILTYWLHQPEEGSAGFTSDVFETVVRGENLTNFNETVINKQPDLMIRLANSPLNSARRHVGVVIETKVVSSDRKISEYTTNGVARFVSGDYAWTMQDGLMIAYQRHPARDIATLAKALKRDTSLLSQLDEHEYLSTQKMPGRVCGKSTHNREWQYIAGGAPGQIRLWHMWVLHLP